MKKLNRVLLFSVIFIIFAVYKLSFIHANSPSDNIHQLSNAGISIKVDTYFGARIISLEYKGIELLTSKEVHPDYFGSSFWLSPSNSYWPPSKTLDTYPYTAEKKEDKMIFTSQKDKNLGLVYQKSISINQQDTCVKLSYVIKNMGDSARKLAAWEVTRFPKEGISVFPVNMNHIEQYRLFDEIVPSKIKDGMMWHQFTPGMEINNKPKLFADGLEGWIAFIQKDILLIKSFNDVPFGKEAPGENDIEIYIKPENNYIEIENQSEHIDLLPGESFIWEVKWYLRSYNEKAFMGDKAVIRKIRSVF